MALYHSEKLYEIIERRLTFYFLELKDKNKETLYRCMKYSSASYVIANQSILDWNLDAERTWNCSSLIQLAASTTFRSIGQLKWSAKSMPCFNKTFVASGNTKDTSKLLVTLLTCVLTDSERYLLMATSGRRHKQGDFELNLVLVS